MQKVLVIAAILLAAPMNSLKETGTEAISHNLSEVQASASEQLYYELGLDGKVCFKAFEQAVEGYQKIKKRTKDLITLIDYSKPSTEQRLFVIDMKQKELLYSSLVAHGKNSGSLYATSFSNKNGSNKSSLGFFITGNTYNSRRNGYSLILEGLEKGINDNARQRSIVIHGAAYSNPSIIKDSGRLGRSLGCPALPENMNRDIINAIKGGSLLYIYADNNDYLVRSKILKKGPLNT